MMRGNWSTGIPGSHSPGNSRRFPEISGRTKLASCRYSWKTVFSRLLQWISVENLSPYPVLKHSLTKGGISKGWGLLIRRFP